MCQFDPAVDSYERLRLAQQTSVNDSTPGYERSVTGDLLNVLCLGLPVPGRAVRTRATATPTPA
jgi:hypothetical protein